MPPQSSTQTEPSDSSPEQEVAEIRQIAKAYWLTLNEYDVDHAITMLEPGYRAQEEELIRKDIGLMKLFRSQAENNGGDAAESQRRRRLRNLSQHENAGGHQEGADGVPPD